LCLEGLVVIGAERLSAGFENSVEKRGGLERAACVVITAGEGVGAVQSLGVA
jgi:hypothetical protein